MESTFKGKRYISQPHLIRTIVRGVLVNSFETTIQHLLFGHNYKVSKTTTKYDHILGQTKDKVLMRDPAQKVALIRWYTNNISK